MAFPRDSLITRGLKERFISSLQRWVPWGSQEESSSDLQVPYYLDMLQECLMHYLSTYSATISSALFSDTLTITRVVEEIVHIFSSLWSGSFTYQEGPRVRSFKPSFTREQLNHLQEVLHVFYFDLNNIRWLT